MKWFFVCIGFVLLMSIAPVWLASVGPPLANLSVQQNFSRQNFLGVWYEIKWLPDGPHNASDIWINFYESFQLRNDSSDIIDLYGRARLEGQTDCFDITPSILLANNSAKMILVQKGLGNQTQLNWPYYILKTDYEHYALIYTCTATNYTYTESCLQPALWMFSRNTVLASEYSSMLERYINDTLKMNVNDLMITPQTGKSCMSSASLLETNWFLLILLFYTSVVKVERK